MANPRINPNNNVVAFGPVKDEQPTFWNGSNLARRDATLLDKHFSARSHGQKIINTNDNSAYAIPNSMKIALRANRVGGLLTFDGAPRLFSESVNQSSVPKLLQQTNGYINNQTSQQPNNSGGWSGEIDAAGILSQRMMGQQAMAMNQPSQQQNQPGSASLCTLREGHTFFQALQVQGTGTSQSMAKTGGQIKGVQGKKFQIDGVVQAYIIDGLQTIDLSKTDSSRLRSLVRVSAPLLGAFLVPPEAIIPESMDYNNGNQGFQQQGLITSGRTLLTDARQNPRYQQQQYQRQQELQASQQRATFVPQTQFSQQQRGSTGDPRQQIQQNAMNLLRRRGILKG